MKLQSAAIVAFVVLGVFGASASAALFEETLAVKVPRGVYGPRGMMGDFVMLKDGTLLMSFTKDGAIMGDQVARSGQDLGRAVHSGCQARRHGDTSAIRVSCDSPTARSCSPTSTRPAGETPYYGHNYYRRSADDGKTWTEQFVMTPHPGYVYRP